MNLQQVRLAVGITLQDEVAVLYAGANAAEAAQACAKAGPEYKSVGVWPKGVMPLMPRYPAKEAAAAAAAAQAEQARAAAELNRKKAEKESKLELSRKLAAEAEALHAEIEANPSESVKPPTEVAAPKPKKPKK